MVHTELTKHKLIEQNVLACMNRWEAEDLKKFPDKLNEQIETDNKEKKTITSYSDFKKMEKLGFVNVNLKKKEKSNG